MGSLLFFFFPLLFLAFSIPKPVLANPELRALMELKSSLDPQNKILKSWTSDVKDPCTASFEGVACNQLNKVANISLQGKGLSGTISPAIAGLKCLSGLYLHYNSLTGEIPREISNLTELTDLYLNVNNLSGIVPAEIWNMAGLQVLQLCCNRLTGNIPREMGSLKRLSVVALQHNRLTGQIPTSLENLEMLKRLDLSFNLLFGPIPARLANIPQLEFLDVQNNSLSGIVLSAFKRLNGDFHYVNNPGLCGFGFSALRVCTNKTTPTVIPEAANIHPHCNQTHCSNSSKLPLIGLVLGVVTVTITLVGAGLLIVFWNRRQKQKIGSTVDASESRHSTDQAKDLYSKSASPLVRLDYCNGWDPLANGVNGNGLSQESLHNFKFNLEEVESATQYFSEANLLGRSNFSCVYKGILRDGSLVAIRSINATSCKSEEAEFVKGLKLLTTLRHENLVRLRGFCCSSGRGECFLIYDFARKGNLSRYLDIEDGSSHVLDWSTRVSVINGIAKGIEYLHSNEANKPAMIHRNISVEKILIDQQFNPLIMDSGLSKLLADDVVFSALKASAAMGYLAPEYITTGRFTEKSDVYAFGVIILQILSGNRTLNSSTRLAAESCRFEEFIDLNLKGKFSESEAAKLAKIALLCTHENPDSRPTMEVVIQELNNGIANS